jgi:large subunit ribosomal protein L25
LDTVKLQAERRRVLGKKVKLLRQQGLVPANMYGHGRESVAMQLPEKLISQKVARASGSALFSLDLDGGESQTVLVKALQRHPTTGRVLHVDFYQVAMTEKLKASVPLHFVGDAPAIKQFEGTLLHNLTSVEVESLPGDLPAGIEVDVSGLATLDDAIHVSDLHVPSGVEVLAPAEELVARVLPPTVIPEEEAAAEEAAAEEAAESEAPVAEAEQPAEPVEEAEPSTSE